MMPWWCFQQVRFRYRVDIIHKGLKLWRAKYRSEYLKDVYLKPANFAKHGVGPSLVCPVDRTVIERELKRVAFIEHAIYPILKYGDYMNPAQVSFALARVPRALKYQKDRMVVTEEHRRMALVLQNELIRRLEHVAVDMDGGELTLAVWSYAAMRNRNPALLPIFSERIPKKLPSLAHPELCTLTHCLARLGPDFYDLGRRALLTALSHSRPVWTPVTTSQLCRAAGLLCPAMDPGLAPLWDIVAHMLENDADFGTQRVAAVAMCVGQFVQRGLLSPTSPPAMHLLAHLDRHVLTKLAKASEREAVAQIVSGLYLVYRGVDEDRGSSGGGVGTSAARQIADGAGRVDDGVLATGSSLVGPTVQRRVRRTVRVLLRRTRVTWFTPQRTTSLMRMCAAMKVQSPVLYKRLGRRAVADLKELPVSDVASLSLACAKVAYEDTHMMDTIAAHVAENSAAISPSDAATLATAYTKLMLPHEGLLAAIAPKVNLANVTPKTAKEFELLLKIGLPAFQRAAPVAVGSEQTLGIQGEDATEVKQITASDAVSNQEQGQAPVTPSAEKEQK